MCYISKAFERVYLTCGYSTSYSALNMLDIDEHSSEQRKRRSEIEETDSTISIEMALSLFTSRLIYTHHDERTYIRQEIVDRFTELCKNFARKLEESTNFKYTVCKTQFEFNQQEINELKLVNEYIKFGRIEDVSKILKSRREKLAVKYEL